MFALKTEVLGQSGTTAATGLTSFIYLKYQNKKNIRKIKDTSKKAGFEGKDRVVVVDKSRYTVLCVMANAIFVVRNVAKEELFCSSATMYTTAACLSNI